MVKKTKVAKPRELSQPEIEEKSNQVGKASHTAKGRLNAGAPIEHFHGEQTHERTGDPGDLDEEELDRSAPYNRTYGLKKDED